MKNMTKVQQLKSVERELTNLITEFCVCNYEEMTTDEKISCLDKTIREMENNFSKAEELLNSESIWFRFRNIITTSKIDLHKQSYINLNCELRLLKELGGGD